MTIVNGGEDPVSWSVETRSGRPFAGTPTSKVSLNGSVLRVRTGAAEKTFDLAAPDVAVTRRQWDMDKGTALRIHRAEDAITVGCEGVFFPGLSHALEVERRPDFVTKAADFEGLHAALFRFIKSDVGSDGRRFLMWGPRDGWWAPVVVPFGVIIVGIASSQLPFSFGLHVLVAVATIALGVALIVEVGQRSRLPKAALTFDEGSVTLSLLRPRPVSLASARIDQTPIEHARWSYPRGGILDNPEIRLSLAPRPFSIGSPRPWVGTRGAKRDTPPDYLIGPAWWTTLIDAITPGAAARTEPSGQPRGT